MTQTALDEFVARTRQAMAFNPNGLDWNVGVGRMLHEDEFNAALQDPRYLTFCEEQDEEDLELGHARLSHDELMAAQRTLNHGRATILQKGRDKKGGEGQIDPYMQWGARKPYVASPTN